MSFKHQILSAVLLILVCFLSPALACVRPPPPFDPRIGRSDIVLIGTVLNDVRIGDRYDDARISITKVAVGKFDQSTYIVDHQLFDGSGMCPLGNYPERGQRLALYFRRDVAGLPRLLGYLPFAQASALDLRLARGKR